MTRRTLLIGHQLLVASICVLQTGNAEAQLSRTSEPQATHTVTTPGNVPWKPFVPPGSEMAVLAGNPDEAGAPSSFASRTQTAQKFLPTGTRATNTSPYSQAPLWSVWAAPSILLQVRS
jgi:hypothetical protein